MLLVMTILDQTVTPVRPLCHISPTPSFHLTLKFCYGNPLSAKFSKVKTIDGPCFPQLHQTLPY